jgi:hypothetical protein
MSRANDSEHAFAADERVRCKLVLLLEAPCSEASLDLASLTAVDMPVWSICSCHIATSCAARLQILTVLAGLVAAGYSTCSACATTIATDNCVNRLLSRKLKYQQRLSACRTHCG